MTRAKGNSAAREVATTQPAGALTTYDYGEHSEVGFEDQDSSYLAIPFLALLQSSSPQVTAQESTLKAGMIYNTVTEEAVKGSEGLLFVPALVQRVYVEWVPRERGGGGGNGFVGIHAKDSDIVVEAKARPRTPTQKRSVLLTEDGNELAETFYLYGVQCDLELSVSSIAVISFTSTKIKRFRSYITKLNLFNFRRAGYAKRPPLYANVARLGSIKQSNTQGDFYNFTLHPYLGDVQPSMIPPTHPAFIASLEVHNMVSEGRARAAFETEHVASGTGQSEETSGDEDIPF